MSQKGNAIELGTQPIGKLLMQYAIPAIIAMTASSLYNIEIVSSSDKGLVPWPSRDWPSLSRS